MNPATERLTALVNTPNPYDIPFTELRQTQLDAINERLASRRDRIRLLKNRAEAAGAHDIRDMAQVVPLLFAHTTYKSYPESWLTEGRWDRLAKWLDTVSTHRVGAVVAGFAGIDDWLQHLETAGHLVSCSSGTTGKCAMLNASHADMAAARRNMIAAYTWATGVAPERDRHIFGLAPVAAVARNLHMREAVHQAFGAPGATPFEYPVAPITIGQITEMVILRKKMADGTAMPAEIAAYEAKSAAREATLEKAVGISAEALVASRRHKLYVSGLLAPMYRIAEAVRAMGYGGKDFHPENTGQIGGGLKGATLPPDHREFIFETFNLSPQRMYHGYGMQELNTSFPKCRAGRYHVAPGVMPLLLDQSGEQLQEPARGEMEGRAAFFDLSLDGRWGGVISGDRITISYDPCACGARGPNIGETITRYADLPGGDKISCAGTIDAYVRGAA
jgi:hypothetical protein